MGLGWWMGGADGAGGSDDVGRGNGREVVMGKCKTVILFLYIRYALVTIYPVW